MPYKNKDTRNKNRRARLLASGKSWFTASVKKAKAKWKKNNPLKVNASTRKRRTGWTHEMVEAAWISQKGLCKICQRPMRRIGNNSPDDMTADHNHKTGKPRALLCRVCNLMEAWFKQVPPNIDPLIWVQSLLNYLTEFPE